MTTLARSSESGATASRQRSYVIVSTCLNRSCARVLDAAPGRGEIRDESLPAAGDGDVVVRALFSGVSRGTEALVFQGRVPVSERERMRAPFQAGEFPRR